MYYTPSLWRLGLLPEIEEVKMTKYYMIEDAINAADWEDTIHNEIYGISFKKKDWREKNMFLCQSLSDKWQIKRAEPKVLSAEEMIDGIHFNFSDGKAIFAKDEIKRYTKRCFQNGQLREWQRPEQVELRESLEKVVEYLEKVVEYYDKHKNAFPQMTMISFDPDIIKRIYEAVMNLKPPKNS